MLLDLHSPGWRSKGYFANDRGELQPLVSMTASPNGIKGYLNGGYRFFLVPCTVMSESGMKDFPKERGKEGEAMLFALDTANLVFAAFALEGSSGHLSALKASGQGQQIIEASHNCTC